MNVVTRAVFDARNGPALQNQHALRALRALRALCTYVMPAPLILMASLCS
jgi:hypothetical protein